MKLNGKIFVWWFRLLCCIQCSSIFSYTLSDMLDDFYKNLESKELPQLLHFRGPILESIWINSSFLSDDEVKICDRLFLRSIKSSSTRGKNSLQKNNTIPIELKESFTMNGRAEVIHKKIDQTSYNHITSQSIQSNWNFSYLIQYRRLPNSCGHFKVPYCDQIFRIYSKSIRKKYGLVLGSTSPWAEAALLNGKAKHITTIDVSGQLQFEGKDSQFQLLSMNKTSQLYLDRQWDPVDFAFSYSFLEHLGFGIIDHSIDPYADLEMLAKIRCLLKPGGLLFLGVPQAPDGIVWNQCRLYGKYRLFLLLLGWKLIDLHPDHCNINQPEKRGNVKCQPVLVLEKPGGTVNHRHHLGNNGGGVGIGHHPHKAHHPIIHQQTI